LLQTSHHSTDEKIVAAVDYFVTIVTGMPHKCPYIDTPGTLTKCSETGHNWQQMATPQI